MKVGDICIHKVIQPDGSHKIRPVLLLKAMPFPGDWLVCAISSQLHQEVKGFDDLIMDKDAGFGETGLKTSSLIRLGFLNTANQKVMPGKIGIIGNGIIEILQKRLANYIANAEKV
jgi:mRNA interferase MazF